MIESASNTVSATIAIGFGALGMAVTPDGTRLYVTDTDPALHNGSVAVIDTATKTLLTRVTLRPFHNAFGSEWFLVRELFACQAAAVRLVVAGLNARQVGRLLGRGEGQPIDGYLIERGASELNTNLWRVMQVDVARV